MLIFIYGNDTFRVQEKVTQMKGAFREKFDPTGMNTAEFSGKLTPADVLGAVRSMPFLGEKRMIIIRDLVAETKKADMDIWVNGLLDAPESSIVIFWETTEPKSLEKKPLFKALREAAEVHDYAFPQLQSLDLEKWIVARTNARGGSLDRKCVKMLIERVGADLWQMDHELSKLVAYANGSQINSAMIERLVHASFEGKIFQLIDAISQRKPQQAVQLLKEERLSGANDHYLLTMLGRQVRILIAARALLDDNPGATKQQLAGTLGVHPFVAQKALAQAKGFVLSDLLRAHDHLFEYDRKIKTGQIKPDLAVDLTTVAMMDA